ncbi:hypothetical protein HN011_009424 [Eciton burchellii]|nr:hypothetical protein HN011_009424 [Eciton burchellii]
MSKRPEHLAPPEVYYDETEAKKYTQNSRIMDIQEEMCRRAIELLLLPEDQSCLLLDIGCGSGLSGDVLENEGHTWIGMDISSAMLNVAAERGTNGNLILRDMGQGLPFRAGIFDGAVSISALQWLCYANKTSHHPAKRLLQFFSTLFACLSRNARAVLQFYPENSEQVDLITTQAIKAGFFGGVIIDYPNSTKAKKMFLVLMTGGAAPLPRALGTGDEEKQTILNSRREYINKARGKSLKKSRDWILEKKERRRKQGKEVRDDNKYTGRKRSGRF